MVGGRTLRRLSHPAFAAAGARVMTLPVSIVCGLLATHLTIKSLGPTTFGVVSLILTLQLVFTFLDLGTGAAVLNEAARFQVHGDRPSLLRTWTTARVVAQRACLTLAVVTVALSAVDAWPGVLGASGASELSVAVAVVVLINLVARPALLALAALQGFGHAVTVVMLQVSVPVVSLLVVVVGWATDAPLAVFAASVTTGQLVCGVGALVLVRRRYGLPLFTFRTARDGQPAPELRSQAGPMLVINLVAPLGMGLDRVALAHLATPLALSSYALVAQLLQPVFTLSATLTQSLWGDFSRKRHEGGLRWEALRGPTGLVVAGAAFAGLGFAVLMPWVADILSGGTISVGWGVSLLAGAVVLVTLTLTIPGAILTSAAGLAAQAKVLVGTVALNLAITWGFAAHWGAAAVLTGSLVGMAVQCVILARLSRSHLRESSAKESTR